MAKVLLFVFALAMAKSVFASDGTSMSTRIPPQPEGDCACDDPNSGTCSQRCYGDNVVWSCVNPRQGCSDTCEDRTRNNTECDKKTLCYGMNCICKTGYGRDKNTYNCVPLNECEQQVPPNKCPENEFYSTCKSQCFTDSCDKRNLCVRNETCQNYCQGDGGCTCEAGFARDPVSRKCIPVDECPTGCPTNEVPVECVDKCLDESCDAYSQHGNATQKPDCVQTDICVPGCKCRPNYFRSKYANGECICQSGCGPRNVLTTTIAYSESPTSPSIVPEDGSETTLEPATT